MPLEESKNETFLLDLRMWRWWECDDGENDSEKVEGFTKQMVECPVTDNG